MTFSIADRRVKRWRQATHVCPHISTLRTLALLVAHAGSPILSSILPRIDQLNTAFTEGVYFRAEGSCRHQKILVRVYSKHMVMTNGGNLIFVSDSTIRQQYT